MIAFSGSWFRRRAALRRAAAEAYARLLRMALSPELYRSHGAIDTFDGRAAMVTVMTALACARLARIGGRDAAELAERLNRRVLDGFDAAFREKGVGDHSIARKVRTLAEAHSGLGRSLLAALAAGGGELPVVLARNGVCSSADSARLAALILQVERAFAVQSDAEIMAGRFAWQENSAASGPAPA